MLAGLVRQTFVLGNSFFQLLNFGFKDVILDGERLYFLLFIQVLLLELFILCLELFVLSMCFVGLLAQGSRQDLLYRGVTYRVLGQSEP